MGSAASAQAEPVTEKKGRALLGIKSGSEGEESREKLFQTWWDSLPKNEDGAVSPQDWVVGVRGGRGVRVDAVVMLSWWCFF
jgi:hypothetical protein